MAGRGNDETDGLRIAGVERQRPNDAPRAFLGGDERGDPVVAVDGADRAALPEGWRRSSADAPGADAAGVLHAAMVQLVRSAGRGCALRYRADAPLRRH